jgi:CDP-diacylglycerol--glycerol-3-phosphate 3-phosphatidyltransferase
MSGTAVARSGLRRDWTVVAVAFAVAFAVVAVAVAALAAGPVAARWAVPAAGVAAFELWFLYRHLGANHGPETDARLHGTLGVANALTLVRGGAFAAVAGFAAVEPTAGLAWLPALLYGGGCVLDWIDGFTARNRGRVTLLGAKLDMAFDTLGFLVAPVVAVLWGRLPVWYLSLSLARYLFRAGRGLRRRRGLAVHDLPASSIRRPLAGLQMVFITVALSPLLPATVVRPLAAAVLVPSLAVFVRDYLIVAGYFRGRKDNA